MLACPNCRSRLARVVHEGGVVYACPKCDGRAVGVAPLARVAGGDFVKRLRYRTTGAAKGRQCPQCGRAMTVADFGQGRETVELDLCRSCHLVWFDPSEYDAVRTPAEIGSGEGFSVDLGGAGEGWKWIPAILGMPIEVSANRISRAAVLTWSITAVTAFAFFWLLGSGRLGEAIMEWGLIPARWTRHSGLTIVTCFFLHAGWLHLLGNLYFLLIFGDNVEDQLGVGRFLLLLAGAHLVGIAAHAWLAPDSTVPLVGASAGISGIIAYYALAFPRARIGLFLWVFSLFRILRMPAIVALVLYVGLQLFGAWRQVQGFGGVSYVAHLGGLAVGALTATWVRLNRPNVSV